MKTSTKRILNAIFPYRGPFFNSIRELQKSGDGLTCNEKFVLALTFGCAALDMLVLYSVLDKAMLQAAIMGKLMAFGIGLILNLIPVYESRLVKQAIYGIKRHAGIMAVIAGIAFFALYGATVYLRLVYHDMYGASGASQIVNSLSFGDLTTTVDPMQEKRGYAVVILLCIEPLATSLTCFVVAFLTDDELKRIMDVLEVQIFEEKYLIARTKAALTTMKRDTELELELDKKELDAAKELLLARGESLKAHARLLLAMFLKNPAATSKLSYELCRNINQDNSNSFSHPNDEDECAFDEFTRTIPFAK